MVPKIAEFSFSKGADSAWFMDQSKNVNDLLWSRFAIQTYTCPCLYQHTPSHFSVSVFSPSHRKSVRVRVFFFNCLTTDVFALPVGVCQLHTRLAVLSWMKQRLVTIDSSQTCKSMRALVLISQKWDVSKLESSYWVNFGRRGRSRWPQGGSAGKERETGRINTAPKIGCHGGGHGGWEWSQAPWSTYVTPSEFPHDLTSGRGAGVGGSQKNQDCLWQSALNIPPSSLKFNIKEPRKITCECFTCALPGCFFRHWASMIVPMFIFWDVEKLERGGSELITSFWTVLTCAFLCTVLCQALDIRLKQKKKKTFSLNICAKSERVEFRARWELGVIEYISESWGERQQTPLLCCVGNNPVAKAGRQNVPRRGIQSAA